MSNNLDWLWQEPETVKLESEVKVAEGGANFASGMIGEWTCGPLYRISTDSDDLATLGIDFDGKQKVPFGTFWYWKSNAAGYEASNAASKQLGQQYGSQHVWHWYMPTNTFLNYNSKDKSVTDVFGESIEFDIPIVTWGSGKQRHLLHLMFMPSVVQELAIMRGYLKERVFDYASLPTEAPDESIMQMVMQEWIGAGDNAKVGINLDTGSVATTNPTSWTNSKLGKARIALWEALGEENPMAYVVTDDASKFKVSSPKLAQLAGLMYRPNTTLWMSMQRVLDPHVAAVSKSSGKHWTTYVCTGIYRSRDEAMVAAGVDAVQDGLPELPKEWEGMTKTEYMTAINTFLNDNKLKGKPAAMVESKLKGMATQVMNSLATTPDALVPWLPHLN